MEALGGRGGIPPTHSRPRHYMGVSGQHHAPAALYPRGKDPPVPIVQEAGWAPEPVWTQRLQEKILCPCRGSNPDRPVVQPVVRHYTAWANRLILLIYIFLNTPSLIFINMFIQKHNLHSFKNLNLIINITFIPQKLWYFWEDIPL
jgi:hypothetical protein